MWHRASDPFASMYYPDARDRETFGDRYTPPAIFSRDGRWHEVARVSKEEGSDGNDCVIDECRMPARFFRLRVLPGVNSVGEPTRGWTMTTGSGDEMGRLVLALAEAAAGGMIGVKEADE